MIKRIALVVCLGLLYNPFLISAQDSTAVKDLDEEKELKFQQYFFKALAEKSIKNYQKAIENLEFCNEVLPEDVTVFFEFSKNYLLLNNTNDAKFYIKKALEKEPQNVWMLEHLVAVHERERDYRSAIKVQQKVVQLNPKGKEHLARLLYQSGDYNGALSLMEELEKKKGLTRFLQTLKRSIESRNSRVVRKENNDLKSIIANFEEGDQSFALLKKLLDKAVEEDVAALHKYSEKAIDLFPAQPYVYLMRGKSLQIQSKNQQAVTMLESGIDFVIDNPSLEATFYETMAKAYDGLGNATKAQEYRTKAKKLKAVK